MNQESLKPHQSPATVGINVDFESIDAANSGQAGLFGRYSYGRYGLREGVERLLRAMDEGNTKATFYAPVSDLTRHPELIPAIIEAGHEIAVRGRVDKGAGADEQLNALGEERAAMAKLLSAPPRGWRSLDGVVTRNTLPALAQLGYSYDSSFCDDDMPYLMADASGKKLVELPTLDYLTDAPFYAQRHTHARTSKAWHEEAEAQYCAHALVHLTLHTRGDSGSTRLPRVEMVSRFLRWLQNKPGIRMYRGCDLADAVLSSAAAEPFPDAPAPQI